MDVSLLVALAVIMACSVVLSLACASFELASLYLGRNLAPGIRGATINAVGSSLPELLTTCFFLFVHGDSDGFAAGIATCAGSAVFNAVIIPAACIFAVVFVGVTPPSGGPRKRVSGIRVARETIWRDGLFFGLAAAVLIAFLGRPTMVWWMGLILMLIYVLYVTVLVTRARLDDVQECEDEAPDLPPRRSFLFGLLLLDLNRVMFGGRQLTKRRAWTLLILSTLIMAIACEELAAQVVAAAHSLDIPSYFAAVVLAAAATSVPDTILSVRDALHGAYDDAVANAFGSNTFDITVALGLPLFVYGLLHGEIVLEVASGVRELQVVLLLVTAFVLALFLGKGPLGRRTALSLLGIYVLWMTYVLGRAIA